ncbi:hypothetical protein NPIL_445951, partial [Nephila pilipes]
MVSHSQLEQVHHEVKKNGQRKSELLVFETHILQYLWLDNERRFSRTDRTSFERKSEDVRAVMLCKNHL